MVDIFILIMIIVLSLVMLVASFYIIVYYSHPDDSGFGSGFLCKIVALLGLFICCGQVLLLPLDVSNIRGSGLDFQMDIVWKILYISIFVFVFVLVPILTSFYELDPEYTVCKKIRKGLCFFFAEILVVIIIIIITYIYLSTAHIPVKTIDCGITGYSLSNDEDLSEDKISSNCDSFDNTLEINVSFIIFVVGLMSFCSYFLFSFFGGIGLISLPLDMIYSFMLKPKKMDSKLLNSMKNEVLATAKDLKELAIELKDMEKNGILTCYALINKDKRKYNTNLKKLKAGVTVLEKQYEIVDFQNIISGRGVISYWLNLFGGIFLGIISLIWVIHIVLYVIITKNGRPYNKFLNTILVTLSDKGISFVAVGIFALLCFYLLMATIKGFIKFGIRFPILGNIHEMKKNETYMNTMLFNIMIIMISSVSVNQFCVKCFNEYAAMTDIDLIFSTQIKYLTFFQYFFKYNIFEYALGVIMVLSLIYLVSRPNDAKTIKKMLYEKIEEEEQNDGTNKEKMIEMGK